MKAGHYVATHQTQVNGTSEEVWRLLTEPAELACWFADVAQNGDKKSFTCNFGDGDFFAGYIKDWDAPKNLGLVWKFMGLGPQYAINFSLSEVEDGVQVSVRDTGALTKNEAESLTLGWQDFFQRLANYARTGENSRYIWSQEISVTAIVDKLKQPSPVHILPEDWWSQNFPAARVNLLNSDTREAVWQLSQTDWTAGTTVKVLVEKYNSNWFLTIAHHGWEENFTPPANIALRKHYAELWQTALSSFESG